METTRIFPALLIGANLLVVNQYIAQFERNGSKREFTDATNPLPESLAPMSDENVHFIDWGKCEPVDFLLRGPGPPLDPIDTKRKKEEK